jgi:ATP-dependent exoDNAse (exonuclease V) alpha subunit
MQIENDYEKEVYNGDIGTIDESCTGCGSTGPSSTILTRRLPPNEHNEI